MDSYKETAETWNKVAKLYQDKFMDIDLYNNTYDFICEMLDSSNCRILEIGCGPGNITKYLMSKRPDFNITGLDIAPNMIELAKRNNPSANFFVKDMRQIKEITERFDAVVCGFCLPYLSGTDASKLISDCHYLLTDSGLLYISFVEGDQNKSGFQVGSSGDRVYFHYHDLDNIEQLLWKNGFEKLKLFKVDYKKADESNEVHTIIITKKKTTVQRYIMIDR